MTNVKTWGVGRVQCGQIWGNVDVHEGIDVKYGK
jgi:hypothetical protein